MQVLVSVCVPPPHVLLHLEADQSVYPPSIAKIEMRKFLHALTNLETPGSYEIK